MLRCLISIEIALVNEVVFIDLVDGEILLRLGVLWQVSPDTHLILFHKCQAFVIQSV